jgi:hypothetical protein
MSLHKAFKTAGSSVAEAVGIFKPVVQTSGLYFFTIKQGLAP